MSLPMAFARGASGRAVFAGGAGVGDGGAATTAVCADVAVVEPFLFVAATLTRIVVPTSVEPSL